MKNLRITSTVVKTIVFVVGFSVAPVSSYAMNISGESIARAHQQQNQRNTGSLVRAFCKKNPRTCAKYYSRVRKSVGEALNATARKQ